MDFNAKNFAYVAIPFRDFMQGVAQGDKMYLRALSEDQPADQPADLKMDFPRLADDFQLPEELSFVTENAFSSVLRISGRVNMWLHYDVRICTFHYELIFRTTVLTRPTRSWQTCIVKSQDRNDLSSSHLRI